MDQLEAAAADVQHDAVLDGQAVHRAEEAQARFLGTVGNPDRDSQLVTDTLDEFVTIAGFAYGGGRYGHRPLGAGAGGNGDKAAHDAQRAFDRLGAQAAVEGDVTDQSQGTARVPEDIQMGGVQHPRHHHPTAVRADIDDAQGLPGDDRLPRGARAHHS